MSAVTLSCGALAAARTPAAQFMAQLGRRLRPGGLQACRPDAEVRWAALRVNTADGAFDWLVNLQADAIEVDLDDGRHVTLAPYGHPSVTP